jgi:sugar phosphate isomerase/epimerase
VFRAAARVAGASGITLCLENEASCWGATGREAAELAVAVDEPNFGILWDPANAVMAGERDAFPAGYSAVAAHVRHVHYKNARYHTPERRRRFGVEGEVDWGRQLAALHEDRYAGYVSIETHLRPKIASTKEHLHALRSFLGG